MGKKRGDRSSKKQKKAKDQPDESASTESKRDAIVEARAGRKSSPVQPLGQAEMRKRRRERFLIFFVLILFVGLTFLEFRISKISNTLPFVNSIFFFGILNINIILLIALFWLIFRNIGKLFVERRSRILGARLKTKLVMAFLAFSITPTLILFTISSAYINSSFDKWFSIRIQNTLSASLEITDTYYRNTDQNAQHFANHLANQLGARLDPNAVPEVEGVVSHAPEWIRAYLSEQRHLLALNAIEFYVSPFVDRVIVQDRPSADLPNHYVPVPLDILAKAFGGESISVVQNMEKGDVIRRLAPVYASKDVKAGETRPLIGVMVVDAYVPVSLVTKVGEIENVFRDYRETNPLQYPIKTTYFVILVMITLVMIFVAIWMGLFMARELTVPVEKLVRGAKQVGSGNLDVSITGVGGNDELGVLVESFNHMTKDLRENRARLTAANMDNEQRKLQLEAVLANVGTGVVVVDSNRKITTFNRAASQLLAVDPEGTLDRDFSEIFDQNGAPLVEIIDRIFRGERPAGHEDLPAEVAQWNTKIGDDIKSLAGIVTSLRENRTIWGVVVVIDDITHLIKAQREMAWREVARRIAHEIKNPLTPIKLSAQRLRRRLSNYGEQEGRILKECTDTIVRHTDELKEMVNEFSNFARFPEVSPAPHDLNLAVQEVMALFSQAHANIQFEQQLEPSLPIFEFDRDQIKRVIINLLDNSIAALGSLERVGDKRVVVETRLDGDLKIASISIWDNGPGMDEDLKSRVFEPYFSTKDHGTGLGLAIVKRIVNDHNGFIRVQSAPREGTRFVIELPTTTRSAMLKSERVTDYVQKNSDH